MLDLHRILGRRPGRRSGRTALHVGVVLAMLGALLLVPVLAASAGGPPIADLTVSQVDTPDPVTSANNVLYEVTVTNLGTASASPVQLEDTLDLSVTFVSVDNGNCSFSGDTESNETVDCTFEGLESGDSVLVDIVVQAPSVSEVATITNVADVSTSDDGVEDPPGNNTSSEDTTVNPQTEGGQVTGYIQPGGGQLTTDPGTGATLDDTTVLTEKFGAGPGGEASVQELDECGSDPLLTPCIGNIGDFSPPPGYTKVVAILLYDRTAAAGMLQGHRREWKIYYEKDDEVHLLPMCPPSPTAGDIPCWKSIVRNDDRDLRVRVLINSDPKLATRK